MENPTTQKDSSKMNTVRRAGLLILMFGFACFYGVYPPSQKKES